MNALHETDDLVALALDALQTDDRERTLRHLADCPQCRDLYQDLAVTVEEVLSAAPRVEPPPGFEARALTAMGISRAVPSAAGRRPGWLLAAASAVVGLLLGIAGTYAVAGRSEPGSASTDTASTVLRTRDGVDVGTVMVSRLGRRPVFVMSVHSGKMGMHYLCRLRLRNGRMMDASRWVVTEPQATWVVDRPVAPVEEILLVAHDGKGPVWSRADL